MSRHKHRRRLAKLKSLYVWHRYIGLVAALFVLVLSVTGIMLNHTERLQLDSRYVQSEALLDWYGIRSPESTISFRVDKHYVTLLGQRLYFNDHEIDGEYRGLTGAVALPGWIVVATDSSILLLTPEGELVEQLEGADGVPSGLRTLGMSPDNELVVDGSHAFYHPDARFVSWTHWEGQLREVRWVMPAETPADLRARLERHYRGAVLPMERVMLDLHSGRILAMNGVWVMDAAAVLLILLSLSGCYMWLRMQLRRRRR